MLSICLQNDTKIHGSTQQYSSAKIKKEELGIITFKNIIYKERLWNGCHFHAVKQFLRKGMKLVPPGRKSTSAWAWRSSLSLLPDLGLHPAGSTSEKRSRALSIALSFLPWLSPKNGKTFWVGKRRGHQNWIRELQYSMKKNITKNISNNILHVKAFLKEHRFSQNGR